MKKGEYVSMRTLKQTLPYLTVSLTILYIFMRIYKFYNPFAFPGIEERISLILVPCLFLTLIFYFPFQKVEKQIKAMSDRLRKFPFQRIEKQLKPITDRLREKVPEPKIIQKRARFNVFKLKFAKKFNIRKIISSENYQKALVKYLFLVFLMIIALLELEPISKHLSFLTGFKAHLLVLAIVFGAITFWQNREVIDEIEEEASKEEEQEEKRKGEFSEKYPRISKIPVFRNIVRWMYKEGWWYSVGLISIIAVYSFLVLYKLGDYSFQVDEFYHALIAKNWFEQHELFKVAENYTYYRGALVSLSAILSKTIFPSINDEFAYRLPIALFGIINVVLIYVLSKKILNNKISLLVTLLFATDIWFVEFARYLRFYTPSITIILLLSIYLINKDFSTKALLFSFCLSIALYFLLTEYFLFIAFFMCAVLLPRLWTKNKKIFLLFFFLSIVLALLLILYRIAQMGFYMGTYNFLNYNLFDLTYTIAHLKWLSLNYWYVLIGVILSLPLCLKSFINALKGRLNKLDLIFLFTQFNFLVIFGYIDHVEYGFTFRPFLFILPIGILTSVIVFYKLLLHKKTLIYFFLLILIISNGYILLSYNPTSYGEHFYPYKLVHEKQPIIIDTKTPYIFFENYVDKNNISNYSTFVVALNEYTLVYYTGMKPDYLVRWKGSSISGFSTLGVPMIWDPDEFVNKIKEENFRGQEVFIITYATIYPVENPLYKFVFNRDYALEAHGRIAQILENDLKDYRIYVGKDNLSSVYYIPSICGTNSIVSKGV